MKRWEVSRRAICGGGGGINSKDGHDIILDMEILYPESTGDHVPFRVGVSIERIPTLDESSSRGLSRPTYWTGVGLVSLILIPIRC